MGIQTVSGDEIDPASKCGFEFVVQRKKLEQTYRMFEIDEDINVTLRRILTAGDRSEDTGVLHVVAFEYWGRFPTDFAEGHCFSVRRLIWLGKIPNSRRAVLSRFDIVFHFCGQTNSRV